MSNIITTQYNNTSIKIQYRNKETGDFIDLNGYTLFFIVKNLNDNFNNDSQAVIKKEYLIENSVDGYFTINLSSEDLNIMCDTYNYQIEIVKDNVVTTLIKAEFIVKQNILKERV